MEKTGYSGVQIALHWAIAGLIVINYFISARMGHALKIHLDGTGAMGGTATVHVYAGVAMLVLVLVRLGVRIAQGVPAPTGHAHRICRMRARRRGERPRTYATVRSASPTRMHTPNHAYRMLSKTT